MTATKLRIVLIVVLILLLSGVGAGVWWMQGVLAQQVKEADHAKTDAELSQQEVEKLRKLQTQMAQQRDIVERANLIAATPNNYQYQDQVVSDLEAYGRRNGITISGFSFTATGNTGNSKADSGPAGTTRTPFTVTLGGPIEYNKFMQFLRDIENNLTKLQVVSLTLSPDVKNPQLVTNPSLSLVVYLKK